MRIAIVGAGAVGCYYGLLLSASGNEVAFLMRSDLDAVRRRGLVMRAGGAERHIFPVAAYGDAREIGPCDLVIITLKTTANDCLNKILPPLLGPKTVALTLQNGLGNEELLAKIAGADKVMGGVCFVSVNRVAPGVIELYQPGYIEVGEFVGPPRERTHAAAKLFRDSGARCEAVESLPRARWRKLCWNIPFNGLTIAAGGIDTARILADPNLKALARQLMLEVQAAAGAQGHFIDEAFIDRQFEMTYSMGNYRPSSVIDYLLGRKVEIEPIWGEALRRAAAAGIETPRLAMLYALLCSLARERMNDPAPDAAAPFMP